jgi:hypothetical protein
MLPGHVDLDELDRSIRIGWERNRGGTVPYPDRPYPDSEDQALDLAE